MGCSNGKKYPFSAVIDNKHGSVPGRKAEKTSTSKNISNSVALNLSKDSVEENSAAKHQHQRQNTSSSRKEKEVLYTRRVDDKTSPAKEQLPKLAGKYVGKIDITHGYDRKSCWITGIDVLSTSQLVLADSNNCSIKIVDSEVICPFIIKETSISPWDVAVLPESRFAVTFPNACKVQFYCFNNRYISYLKCLKLTGRCHGIAYQNNKLYVSFAYPSKIQVIDMVHQTHITYRDNSDGINIFDLPWYLAVSPNQNDVFVTDDAKNSVVKLSKDISAQDKEKFNKIETTTIQTPWGIALTSSGQLLIASESEDKVYQMSPDFSKKVVVLEGMHAQALCYCHKQKRLYVAQNGSDNLLVYKI